MVYDGRGGGIRTPDPLLPNLINNVLSETYRERLALLNPVKPWCGFLAVGLKWGRPISHFARYNFARDHPQITQGIKTAPNICWLVYQLHDPPKRCWSRVANGSQKTKTSTEVASW